jgi:menaquinol-cytochrome c reductase iron-sulfur subunit
MDRRKLLKFVVQTMGLVPAAVVGVPWVMNALAPVLRRWKVAMWQPLGPLQQFPIGETVEAVVHLPREDWAKSLRERAVYVWRPRPDELVVFSRNCTDLSCPVNWDPGSACFYCPCHGGIFARDGSRMAGPPREPLYRYANRVRRDGLVEIDINSLPPMT